MAVRLFRGAGLAVALLAGVVPAAALDVQKALTQYTRSEWTQAEGLPQETIRSIAQTADGYLWLGTGEGVARFDGREFITFSKSDGLPGNSVISIAAAKDGGLWLGTNEGLARYSGGRFQKVLRPDGVPLRPITSIIEDENSVAWVVSAGLLWKVEQGIAKQVPMADLAPIESVRLVHADRENRLWVAGVNGVVRADKGGFSAVAGPKVLNGRVVTSLLVRSDGLWMAGNAEGIVQLRPDGTFRTYTTRDGLPNDFVIEVLQDRAGNIWAGTYDGLSRFKNGRFEGPLVNRRGESEWVWSLFEDREANLWVGASDRLVMLRDDLFTMFGRPEGLPSDQTIAAYEDAEGVLWIGFRDKGLVSWTGASKGSDMARSIRHFTTADGLPSNEIFSIRGTRDGDLLIGTTQGFSRLHQGHFVNSMVPDPANRLAVHDVLEDRRGHLWAATPSGVYRLHSKKGKQRWVPKIPGGLNPASYATVLSEGPDGSIWAGTFSDGLWKVFDPKVPDAGPQHVSSAEGLVSHQILSLEWDDDGTLWAGTVDGGLTAYWNGEWHALDVKAGLISDNISHINDDGENLWLSTTRGISRLAKSQIRDLWSGKIDRIEPVNYGLADGLRSLQTASVFPSSRGGTRTRDGRLWFTTGLGLAMFNPKGAVPYRKKHGSPAAAHVLEMLVDGSPVDLRSGVQLQPDIGRVEFRYVGIHLSAPETVQYSFRLDGLDDQWIPAGNRQTAGYNQLPQGDYRFRVRAALPDGGVSEASYGFAVLPHFYETRSFMVGSLLAVLAMIYGGYHLRVAQMQSRFEAVFQERARLAREIHDTLAQGFVGIAHQLDALAAKLDGDPAVAHQHLTLARRMTRHSLTEARRSMMDMRMTELQDQCLSTALAAAAPRWVAGTRLTVQTAIQEIKAQISKDLEQNVFRIAQEAVSNVVKHAQAQTISLELAMVDSRLCLSVRDDGRGFASSGSFTGTDGHFGIVGMRERAERFGGNFSLASEPGLGTQVKVEIPLDSNAV